MTEWEGKGPSRVFHSFILLLYYVLLINAQADTGRSIFKAFIHFRKDQIVHDTDTAVIVLIFQEIVLI